MRFTEDGQIYVGQLKFAALVNSPTLS
jgi:hypothetical protein